MALRRPYTVAVTALLLIVLGALSVSRMIVDIFPSIDIPVVVVVWNYPGLSPEDMERRVVLISERAYSTTVNGIQRIESQSIPGVGILKVYFQPGSDIGAAIAQISSVSFTILRIAPPGMQPPTIVQFSATNVPVAQLTVSSKTIPEQNLFDYGLNFIRVRLFTIPGLSAPAPFGGKNRQIMIDVNPDALAGRGLSPADVVNALQSSNSIIPAGTARIGGTEYNVMLNSSPKILDQFKNIPIKIVGNAPVYLGDVATVSDSYAEQTNIVRVNGRRATYLAILKHADASTLAVVDATRDALPQIREVAPRGMEVKIDFDQSVFVRGAIEGVVREAILASILVSLMILIFLGSWRSMVVVSTSIPLAIFAAIICLNLAGDSVNIMTLGGLALAIGMLVDDATVAVENIHRNRALGKPLTVAVMDGKISLYASGTCRRDVDARFLRPVENARARSRAHAHEERTPRNRDQERGSAAIQASCPGFQPAS
jgi:multidrug efflux pump subunit AcrB